MTKTYKNIKPNRPYLANYLTIGNAPKNKPHKSKFHNRTIVVKQNNPQNSDIPSFEHGCVHVYDSETDEYYGAVGIFYLARAIGFKA